MVDQLACECKTKVRSLPLTLAMDSACRQGGKQQLRGLEDYCYTYAAAKMIFEFASAARASEQPEVATMSLRSGLENLFSRPSPNPNQLCDAGRAKRQRETLD